MDVIVVLPITTSETLGALNSMGPGGTNHLDNLLLLIQRGVCKTSLKCLQTNKLKVSVEEK